VILQYYSLSMFIKVVRRERVVFRFAYLGKSYSFKRAFQVIF